MIDATRAVETARASQQATRQRHQRERLTVLIEERGSDPGGARSEL